MYSISYIVDTHFVLISAGYNSKFIYETQKSINVDKEVKWISLY